MDLEKRYHCLHLPQVSGSFVDQPARVNGYQINPYINQTKLRIYYYYNNQIEQFSLKSQFPLSSNSKATIVSRNSSMRPKQIFYNFQPLGPVENAH